MPRLRLVGLLALVSACTPSTDLRSRPQLIPPYLPIGGPQLARLGAPVDTTFLHPVTGHRFIFLRPALAYYATAPQEDFRHEFTAVSVDSSGNVQCLYAYRHQHMEQSYDSMVTALGQRPRRRIEGPNRLQAYWWDDRRVIGMLGTTGVSATGVQYVLTALPPGETFDSAKGPIC